MGKNKMFPIQISQELKDRILAATKNNPPYDMSMAAYIKQAVAEKLARDSKDETLLP